MSNDPESKKNAPRSETGWLEHQFERFLWRTRFLVIMAVVASLLAAFVLFIVGTMDLIGVAINAAGYYMGASERDIHDFIVTDVILAVDIYLVALVLLIFALGIYRLFVSPIDPLAERESGYHPFNVGSFDELKDKIVRVVILAVIIEFFRAVVDIRFETPLDAIYLALSVLALAVALFLMSWHHGPKHK